MWREREVDGDWYLTVVEPRLRYFHDPVPCAQACLAGRGRNPDLESVLRSFGTLAPTRDGALADIFLGRGRPRVSSPGAADDGAAAGSERAMSVLEVATVTSILDLVAAVDAVIAAALPRGVLARAALGAAGRSR